ncbi:hypothetical protein INS49_004091 [Diaporthe citri]|uniref:uncharacterized protein n=1 Tax=Diaporthe citri TaxID=83186 RepID=UPI001C7E3106|nr:uncharacterized protein INS49_004091 [Diaporthe citri]KAG6355010.1 hypothetical protein INS49_004091 [Diaporthe citri]
MPEFIPKTPAPANNIRFFNWPGAGEEISEILKVTHAAVIPPGVSTIHVGGQVGLTVPAELEEEVKEAFEHIELSLRAAGLPGTKQEVWAYVYKVGEIILPSGSILCAGLKKSLLVVGTQADIMPKVNSDIERHVKGTATLRNPRLNTPSNTAFCTPGRFSLVSIGMGNAKTIKSVKMLPMAPPNQVESSGRHFTPGKVLSQKPARGRQRKKHCRIIATHQAPTPTTMDV